MLFGFEHDDFASLGCQLARDGKANDATANDCTIDFFGHDGTAMLLRI
jgi:hypothetical protein